MASVRDPARRPRSASLARVTGMTVQAGGPARGGSSRWSLLVIFTVAAIPIALLLFAWVSGHRTDISLDIPHACEAVDADALTALAPGGTPVASRSVGSTSAVDTCTVRTTGHDLVVSVGAEPRAYDAAYRSARCTAVHATPATSGTSVSCTSSDAETSPATIDQYVWSDGVYEVHLGYRASSPATLSAAATSTADRVVRTLVGRLPTR